VAAPDPVDARRQNVDWVHRHWIPRSMTDGPPSGRDGGIRVHGLAKTFRGPQGPIHAVRGIDFSIAAGETVALLGPNGAGKSTTIDMLLGLAKPDRGTVSVFDHTAREAVDAGLVGAMLQTGELIRDLSVREIVAMMASLYPDPMDVDEALELTGLKATAGQRTQKLSGGQTQRVRFAVALVSNPDLLVLDEPTVALDVEGRREFWVSMRAFAARGRTILFATHYLEEADANADRAILMAHGRIVADGPTTEIKARVGRRTIRTTLPDVDAALLGALPGVASVERHGEAVIFSCTDSDQAIRALLERHPLARDIEITGGSLEDAFLELTGEPDIEESQWATR
jgi:ABC-2 type transport system ATP-binding protein